MRTQFKFTQELNLLTCIIYSRILASIFWACELDFKFTYTKKDKIQILLEKVLSCNFWASGTGSSRRALIPQKYPDIITDLTQ